MKKDMDCEERLKFYRLQVKEAIEKDLETPFPNESKIHARVIVEEFVRAAKRSVDILCGRFSKEVYGNDEEMERIFRDAQLLRGVKVRILHYSEDPDSEDLATKIRNAGGQVLRAEKGALNQDLHFLVVDSKRYRIESDQLKRSAVACANAPVMAGRLSELFEKLFKCAKQASGASCC